MAYIASGKEAGANVAVGGERFGPLTGYFIQPTIFTDVTPDMKIVREEIFGPVVALSKFKDEAEVIDLANATSYGLSSVVLTENINRALRMASALESGSVFVSVSSCPFLLDAYDGRSTEPSRLMLKYRLVVSSSQDSGRTSVTTLLKSASTFLIGRWSLTISQVYYRQGRAYQHHSKSLTTQVSRTSTLIVKLVVCLYRYIYGYRMTALLATSTSQQQRRYSPQGERRQNRRWRCLAHKRQISRTIVHAAGLHGA